MSSSKPNPMFKRFLVPTLRRMSQSPYKARITSVEPLSEGRWIQTRKINYTDPVGRAREWEMAVRTTKNEGMVDAVSIVSILKQANEEPRVVLVKQFRPPTEKVVIELPAGLIDKGESIASTAVRELHEETGYHGTFRRHSPDIFSDPGLTNASMVLAYVDVDLDHEKNHNVVPQLEDGEFIETFTLPLKGLVHELEKLIAAEGCTVDARLYHLAVGLDLLT